ncbi:MAG: thioredoxin-disulfide reductase [Oscillospiraceae bacterium]|nr:thioredoxin-disulfide reductase [Oscillospiraceae bacterium]
MREKYDIVIIGTGPAGYAAGLYGARGALRTLILGKGMAGGQMAYTNQIDNYPGASVGVGGFDLADNMKRQAEYFGAEIRMTGASALDLSGREKIITLGDGTEVSAGSVVLAMGASPRLLGVPGEAALRGHGVSYCATCDGMFFRNKTVAVVGGGDTALEDALLLAKTSQKVYLIHRRDTFRATPLYVELAKQSEKIELVLSDTVDEICGEKSVTGVKLHSGRTLDCHGVFIAVGTVPNSKLVEGVVQCNDKGYVVTDETMKTSVDGVFAAGDIRQKPLRQVITAASDGAVAATSAGKYLLEQHLK